MVVGSLSYFLYEQAIKTPGTIVPGIKCLTRIPGVRDGGGGFCHQAQLAVQSIQLVVVIFLILLKSSLHIRD